MGNCARVAQRSQAKSRREELREQAFVSAGEFDRAVAAAEEAEARPRIRQIPIGSALSCRRRSLAPKAQDWHIRCFHPIEG